MSRKPRRKLPEPLGYTTEGGKVERDLFLIRTCRDLSPNTSYYTQLEARRFDAELAHATSLAVETSSLAHAQLTSLGVVINEIDSSGVVLHRTDVDALPPRLRNELATWHPPSGAAAARGGRDSVIPWMLLARMKRSRLAISSTSIPLQVYRETWSRGKGVLQDRVRTRYDKPSPSTVDRVCSHIAELGQARYRRYSRYDRQLYDDKHADLRMPPSLIGVHLPGITQQLARGSVTIDLSWESADHGCLVVHVMPQGNGATTRYEIIVSAEELSSGPTSPDTESKALRKPSKGMPDDAEWADAEQAALDVGGVSGSPDVSV